MIYLIAGHHRAGLKKWPHGRDPGAVREGDNEHWMAERLVTEVAKCFDDDVITVCPFTYNLQAKINWVNKRATKEDVVISVHMNAGGGTGTELYYRYGSPRGLIWGKKIANILSETLILRNRGAKKDTSTRHGRLGIVRDINCTGLLLEMGFIDSDHDYKQVENHGVQSLIDVIQYFKNISNAYNK